METRLKSFNKFVNEVIASENLKYHVDRSLSIAESAFRPGSTAHLELIAEARALFESGDLILNDIDRQLFETTDLGKFANIGNKRVPLDLVLEIDEINEAKKKKSSKKELGVPKRGGPKKYHVYVRNPKTGNIKRIVFGDVHGGLTAKVSNEKARKSFAARHRCAEKKDRMSAGYWACRINRYAHLWGGKTYPGYW